MMGQDCIPFYYSRLWLCFRYVDPTSGKQGYKSLWLFMTLFFVAKRAQSKEICYYQGYRLNEIVNPGVGEFTYELFHSFWALKGD
jgi:hypothetical protein